MVHGEVEGTRLLGGVGDDPGGADHDHGAVVHGVVEGRAGGDEAVDLDGPDRDGTLYVHGSVAARWLTRSEGATVCVTVTEVDGLVTARSAFH
ncbi:MAG: pyridoxamine 5'-phosphate oxidase family protein, partial [Nocardioides sp.]|nr:pyridoxamine 5'-phosphate oxidase family protein [Nocardioides sp.]